MGWRRREEGQFGPHPPCRRAHPPAFPARLRVQDPAWRFGGGNRTFHCLRTPGAPSRNILWRKLLVRREGNGYDALATSRLAPEWCRGPRLTIKITKGQHCDTKSTAHSKYQCSQGNSRRGLTRRTLTNFGVVFAVLTQAWKTLVGATFCQLRQTPKRSLGMLVRRKVRAFPKSALLTTRRSCITKHWKKAKERQ